MISIHNPEDMRHQQKEEKQLRDTAGDPPNQTPIDGVRDEKSAQVDKQPATEGDEKKPKLVDPPATEEDEKNSKVVDPPGTEGNEQTPIDGVRDEKTFKVADPPSTNPSSTEGDDSGPKESDPPGTGTGRDDEDPKVAAPPATGEDEKTKIQMNGQEITPELKYDSLEISAQDDNMNDPSGNNHSILLLFLHDYIFLEF